VKKVVKLSKETKARIYREIRRNMLEDDPCTSDVIRDDYGGNEDRYLLEMGRYHGILKHQTTKKKEPG
jgi:hypothetical protein